MRSSCCCGRLPAVQPYAEPPILIRMANRLRIRPHGLALALGLSGTVPLAGQDSTAPPESRRAITLGRVAPIGGLLVAAALADNGLRIWSQRNRSDWGDRVASVGDRFGEGRLVLPALGAVFLTARLAGWRTLSDDAFNTGRAVLTAGAVSLAMKVGFGRARPVMAEGDAGHFRPFSSSDGFNALPSGHVTVAFALASSLAQRTTDRWVKRLFYAGASLTAFARVNYDKHWVSDVVAGALIGHFTARAVESGRLRAGIGPAGVTATLSF